MGRKITAEILHAEFNKRNCTLLNSEDYKNNKSELKYTCNAHNEECTTTWARFFQGQSNCRPCIRDKIITTCQLKYGVDFTSQLEEIKKKKSEAAKLRWAKIHELNKLK